MESFIEKISKVPTYILQKENTFFWYKNELVILANNKKNIVNQNAKILSKTEQLWLANLLYLISSIFFFQK